MRDRTLDKEKQPFNGRRTYSALVYARYFVIPPTIITRFVPMRRACIGWTVSTQGGCIHYPASRLSRPSPLSACVLLSHKNVFIREMKE